MVQASSFELPVRDGPALFEVGKAGQLDCTQTMRANGTNLSAVRDPGLVPRFIATPVVAADFGAIPRHAGFEALDHGHQMTACHSCLPN